jgi:hypothetical protein
VKKKKIDYIKMEMLPMLAQKLKWHRYRDENSISKAYLPCHWLEWFHLISPPHACLPSLRTCTVSPLLEPSLVNVIDNVGLSPSRARQTAIPTVASWGRCSQTTTSTSTGGVSEEEDLIL